MVLISRLEIVKESNFNDVLTVYNDLSEEEKRFIDVDGSFEDSPYLFYRKIKYVKSYPIAFIEVYKDKNEGAIAIAVNKKYRGQGIASDLIRNAMVYCKRRNIVQLIYKVNKKNQDSIKLASKFGSIVASDNNFYWFGIPLK